MLMDVDFLGAKSLTLKPNRPATQVQFGNTWALAHDHPGQYLRGRYGPMYLKHSQSWRFVKGMNNSIDNYGKSHSQWTSCESKPNHACLNHYPTDGNWLWLPHRYP